MDAATAASSAAMDADRVKTEPVTNGQQRSDVVNQPTPAEPANVAPPASEEPISDLAIAAQYADIEMQSVVAQFESTKVATTPTAATTTAADDSMDESSSDSEEEKEDAKPKPEAPPSVAKEEDESSSDEEEEEDRAKLRADIEAAMEKEDAKVDGPLKTANEVEAPVREPSVELTPDCAIAQCGTVLNVSVPGLMMTIKSNPNAKPLEEGSVLCLKDRTVLGCVDEVFGPVLMPMYLIRFENAAKMSEKAAVNAAVFYPTDSVTYIVPENIKDKGTDASNIFDEEADDADFSDDEAEAAAKRSRKRNRNGANAAPVGGQGSNYSASPGGSRGGRGNGNFSDYRSGQGASFHAGRGNYGQPQQPALQTQPYGGVTKYTQGPGSYGAPRAPMAYGNTNYTSPQHYGGPPPPMPSYNTMGMPQPRPGQQMPGQGYYQPPPPQYHAHNLPPYPPQAPPPPQYQQYPPQPNGYAQKPPPRYTQTQPPPPRSNGYYGANGQQQPQQPRGPYD